MCTQPCPLHGAWIPVHAQLPIAADGLEGRQAGVGATSVLDVVLRTDGHLGQHFCHRVVAGAIHICANGGIKGPKHVETTPQNGGVEEDLQVFGNDRGRIGIRVDERKQTRNPSHLFHLGRL